MAKGNGSAEERSRRRTGAQPRTRETVVITGASAGVGRATARRFGRAGARVALLARGTDGLEAARREIEEAGGDALAIPTDVSDPEQVEAAAERTERTFGTIDVWVNNAMVSVFSPVREMTPEDYQRVTEVTYLGQVYGALSALRRMLPRDRGTIVFVSSVLAYRGIPLQSAYCAAKHAVEGFFDSLRSELLHDGSAVHVTMVNLPGLNTPQFEWVKTRLPGRPQPVPPIFQPEVAADAVYWASRHRRRALTVGGKAAAILWGNKFLPGVGDRYLALTGVESQQQDEPVAADRRHNLYEPLPGDHGAHGEFDDRAIEGSTHLWANTHRGVVALMAGAVAALVTAATLRR